MLPRTKRFLGRGNYMSQEKDGPRRHGWKVQCSECPEIKTVFSAGSRSMPPEAIIKKLVQAGWWIGNKPKDDVCPGCQRKTVESRLDIAKKALSLAMAPSVPNGSGATIHYSELLALAMKLPPKDKQELVKSLRATKPERNSRPAKKVSSDPETDSEYQQWLEQQD